MAFDIASEIRRCTHSPQLEAGCVSWSVKLLRRGLAAAGQGPSEWLDLGAPVSDVLDSALSELLRGFQTACALPATGIVDYRTWQALATRLEQTEPASLTANPAEDESAVSNDLVRGRIVELAKIIEKRHIREHGPNRGATVETILRHAGGQPGMAWCLAFCWGVIDLAYLTLDLEPPAMDKLSCSRLVKWATASHRLITAPEQARPGDLLVLEGGSTGYRHVGIMVGPADELGRIPTIEGNTDLAGDGEGDGIYARMRNPALTPCVFVRV